MLVLFLILFTKVLADSEEDKYVDLLPDAEKQQFIEKVARRILKDVQSQENRTNVKSGEMSDDQLIKHNDYVKAIIKEEAEIRRSKGEIVKDKEEKPASEEKETLDVKPLETEKMAIPDDPDVEQVDLTLRNDRRENAAEDVTATDYIKVEIVTDNVPIIKRSVQDDSANKSFESDETTAETLERVQSVNTKTNQAKVVTEKSDSIQSTNKTEVVTSTTATNIVSSTTKAEIISTTTVESKLRESTMVNSDLSKPKNENSWNVDRMAQTMEQNETKNNDLKEIPKLNDLDSIESTTAGDNDEEIVLVEGRHSGSGESDTEAILVRGIDEPWLRKSNNEVFKSAEKTTKSDFTTSVIEYFGMKANDNKSDEYNNVSSANEGVTTVNYPFNSNAIENATTQSTTTTTTAASSTTYTSTTQVNEAPTMRTEMKTTEYTGNELDATTESNTESTLTSIMTDEGTIESVIETTTFIPETTPETKEPATESTPATNSPESSTHNIFIPVITTEDMKIIVEDFTSAPSKKYPSKKKVSKKRKQLIKHRALDIEYTTKILVAEEKSEEPATEKPKVIFHKLEKVILGPKALKLNATSKPKNDDNHNKNFIELEKVYYDNNYKVKRGNEYQVYEIPADKSPFLPDEDTIAEQPYYVPVYNYSPDNAYFNPQNRLGPNPDDSSSEKVGAFTISDNDSKPQLNNVLDTPNVDMEYSDSAFENKRKKFGGQQKSSHNMYRQPQPQIQLAKKRGKVNPEDYVDADYYFGRVRKDERRVNQEEFYTFPNSDENDHPAHSIQEGNLKDHVRAVRNILFHQKSFGLLEKDKYGSKELRLVRKKKPIFDTKFFKKPPSLRTSHNEDAPAYKKEHKAKSNKNRESESNIAIDYYFGREQPVLTKDIKNIEKNKDHFQKVGYLKNQNSTKELYIMDDYFKENVVKYIEELKSRNDTYIKADLMPATPLPQPGKIVHLSEKRNDEISNFREQEKKRNADLMKNSEANNAEKQDLRVTELKEELQIETLPLAEVNEVEDTTNTGDVNYPENADPQPVYERDDEYNTLEPPTNEEVNLQLNNRRNDDIRVSVYLQVLKDMILSVDNNALKQYDWLGTTVDIQSALQKMFELTSLVVNNEDIHPADMEILKYVVFLHKLASEIIEANDFGAQLRKKLVLPRNKKKKLKPNMLKEKGLINRVWLYLRREVPEVNENGALRNLNKFLKNIEDGLFDLHDAIKHIAKITKYRNQKWYQNLKDLYINTDEKHLLELLLHMTVLRLFSLIEESAKHGLEDDYVQYMKENRKESKKTLEEMMFVMQILEDYNKFVE